MLSEWMRKADGDFETRVAEFLLDVKNLSRELAVHPDDLALLLAALRDFERAVADQAAKQAAFREAVDAKKARRTFLERELRSFARRINHDPAMTDNLRAYLGLAVLEEPRAHPPDACRMAATGAQNDVIRG